MKIDLNTKHFCQSELYVANLIGSTIKIKDTPFVWNYATHSYHQTRKIATKQCLVMFVARNLKFHSVEDIPSGRAVMAFRSHINRNNLAGVLETICYVKYCSEQLYDFKAHKVIDPTKEECCYYAADVLVFKADNPNLEVDYHKTSQEVSVEFGLSFSEILKPGMRITIGKRQ